jgi:NADPH:quinone reductase-like Zn-dependent oxidoreductase
MRQIVIPRHGPPEVLVLRDAPDPVPGPGEVRIAVRAAGVNFADVMARLGIYPDAPPPPLVVGYEVAGVIDALGPGVAAHRLGERVVAFTRFGGYASMVVTGADFAFPAPADLSDIEAAAVPVNYLTALVALDRLGNLGVGETVLIHGVGGGVGTAALQLACLRRATVIGTASAAKHPALQARGVHHLIDPRAGGLAAAVRRITGGRGVDVVLDPIGGASFAESYALLAPLGRLIVYGASSAAPGPRRSWWRMLRTMAAMPRFRPLKLMDDNRGVLGLNLGRLWDEVPRLAPAMTGLLDDCAAGRLKPVIDRSFPLEHAADAHRLLQARGNLGKVMLTVAPS